MSLTHHAAAAAAALALSLGIGASAAEAKSCPGYTTGPKSGLGIIKVKASGTSCRTAKNVAKGFDIALMGTRKAATEDNATVYDRHGRKWKCRITERATGTDPGYIPYTSVACKRRSAHVSFKFAS